MKKLHIIMAEDNDQQADEQQADDAADKADEQDAERTDWKAKAIENEAKFKAENGIRRRLEKDLKQKSEKPTETSTDSKPQDKKGFDYGQLAYLEAKGITDPADQTYLEGLMKESGSELKDLLAKPWVLSELKERKDVRMSEEATPSKSKRAGNTTRDQVDYWLAKGELPPADQRELRLKVVNARIEREKNQSQFTGQSVAGTPQK